MPPGALTRGSTFPWDRTINFPTLIIAMLDFSLYVHKTPVTHINQSGRETTLVAKHWDLASNEHGNWVYAGPQHSAHCLSSGRLCFQTLVLIEPIIEHLSSLVPVPRTRILLSGLPAMRFMWKEGLRPEADHESKSSSWQCKQGKDTSAHWCPPLLCSLNNHGCLKLWRGCKQSGIVMERTLQTAASLWQPNQSKVYA